MASHTLSLPATKTSSIRKLLPEKLRARLALLFLALMLVSLSLVVFNLALLSSWGALNLFALLAIGLLIWRWSVWYRFGASSYTDLALEGVTTALVAAVLFDPLMTLAIVYTGFYFRPMVGSMAWAITGAVTSTAGLMFGVYLSSHPDVTVLSGSVLGQLPLLVITALIGVLVSVIAHKQSDLTSWLESTERKYRTLVERLPQVVFSLSPDGTIAYMSPQSLPVLDWSPDRLVGQHVSVLNRLIHHESRDEMADATRGLLVDGAQFDTEVKLISHSGRLLWARVEGNLIRGAGGEPDQFLGTISDLTERKMLEGKLTHQATHDLLTGLPNRARFREWYEQLRDGDRSLGPVRAVLFLDIDNFKIVNDSLGHDAGDELLKIVSRRVEHVLRPNDLLARFGGDEFVVLLDSLKHEDQALDVVGRIAYQFGGEILIGEQRIQTTVSIGIAFSRPPHSDDDELIRAADLAMYQAKQNGKSRYVIFSPEMQDQVIERLELETELRDAVARDEFTLHYQPIIDLQTGSLHEVEALVRWNHPVRGLLMPGEFLPVAQETGIIRDIDRWVLIEGARQVREWQQTVPGRADLGLSVNVSPAGLRDPALADAIASAISESGLAPERLKLEINERAMVSDIDLARESLKRLGALGVSIAVDDFGVENSGLSYLRLLPLNTIKLDRSFVTGIHSGSGDPELVRALIRFAGALGLSVTAEGIESDEYVELRSLGCDYGQGYSFARPLAPADLRELLESRDGFRLDATRAREIAFDR